MFPPECVSASNESLAKPWRCRSELLPIPTRPIPPLRSPVPNRSSANVSVEACLASKLALRARLQLAVCVCRRARERPSGLPLPARRFRPRLVSKLARTSVTRRFCLQGGSSGPPLRATAEAAVSREAVPRLRPRPLPRSAAKRISASRSSARRSPASGHGRFRGRPRSGSPLRGPPRSVPPSQCPLPRPADGRASGSVAILLRRPCSRCSTSEGFRELACRLCCLS